jgi:hypothetical protein
MAYQPKWRRINSRDTIPIGLQQIRYYVSRMPQLSLVQPRFQISYSSCALGSTRLSVRDPFPEVAENLAETIKPEPNML